MRIGVIGVGQMGGALARCWLEAGHALLAFDVRAGAVAALAGHPSGRARAAASPREVAARSELIGIVVGDDAQVLDALLGPDGVLAGTGPGAVVMIHSTIGLETLRRAGEAAARRGVALLEAAVSGADGHRSAGALCVMVGGEGAAFERARPALEAIGSLVLHLGPLGAGMDAKLARNLIAYQQFRAGYEGALLAGRLGIAPAALRAILEHTGVLAPNLAAFLDARGGMLPIGPESPEQRAFFATTAATARKDLAAALARAREVGLELPGAADAAEAMAAVFGVAQVRGR